MASRLCSIFEPTGKWVKSSFYAATSGESGMTARNVVVVSSTVRDLAGHRALVRDAIWLQGLFPEMMERVPASNSGKIAESKRLVDGAHIYLGIFAHRYGEVPDGYEKSITEMEYDWACERGIPRLIFVMGPDHGDLRGSHDEDGLAAEKMEAFKARMMRDKENICNFFNSPEDLCVKVIHSLTPHAHSDVQQTEDVPAPPEPYVAHRYLLMRSTKLIGRGKEQGQLTDWVANPQSEFHPSRVLSIVAVGGMGKSALTWNWFQEIAPQQMKPLAGRLWWSFYEAEARFENFLVRSLAYVSRRPFAEIEGLKPEEQIRQLIDILDREPYLLVLDGLERLLLAYNRLDADRLNDEELDAQTGHAMPGHSLLPSGAGRSLSDQHLLRKAVDDHVGQFLRRLAGVRQSRTLISTRLAPADLQVDGVNQRLGSAVLSLAGLEDPDALALWKACRGQVSDSVLSVLNLSGNHPLAIQVLASTVSVDPAARGDFSRWRQLRPDFKPGSLPLVQVQSHVLEFALKGLSERSLRALQTVGALRAQTTYDTLVALLVREASLCQNEGELIDSLRDLEDRGLLGWDPISGRYDLHPIVRSVTHAISTPSDRQRTYALLERHFASLPPVADRDIGTLDSLLPTLEWFNALVNQERFDEAHRLFFDRLATPLLRWLDAHRMRVQLLEALFPPGAKRLPMLSSVANQAQALNALSLAYRLSGRPGPAAVLSRLDVELLDREGAGRDDLGGGRGKLLCRGLRNLALALSLTGELREAEAAASRAIAVDRDSTDPWAGYWEALDLGWLAGVLSRTGRIDDADRCLRRAIRIMAHHDKPLSQARFILNSARIAFLNGDLDSPRRLLANAQDLLQQAGDREKPDAGSPDRESLFAERMRAQILLVDGSVVEAEEILYDLLFQTRNLHLIHDEVDIRTILAGLRCQQRRLDEAEELLSEVWSWVEFGPYRLLHADAQLVLSRIHQSADRRNQAIEAAQRAAELAWCNGPGHSYHRGLQAAREMLHQLGVPQPIPARDSDLIPLVPVEIDPPGEFFVGPRGRDGSV
jgi:tetratricopeptide (TPR) repeat protein